MTALRLWPFDQLPHLDAGDIAEVPDPAGNTIPAGSMLIIRNSAQRPKTVRITHPDLPGDPVMTARPATATGHWPRAREVHPSTLLVGPIAHDGPGQAGRLLHPEQVAVITYPGGVDGLTLIGIVRTDQPT